MYIRETDIPILDTDDEPFDLLAECGLSAAARLDIARRFDAAVRDAHDETELAIMASMRPRWT